MKLPSRRKLFLFGILTLVYAGLALFVIAISAVATCSMQPDVAAGCDLAPVFIIALVATFIYAALAIRFFRAKLNGVD